MGSSSLFVPHFNQFAEGKLQKHSLFYRTFCDHSNANLQAPIGSGGTQFGFFLIKQYFISYSIALVHVIYIYIYILMTLLLYT